VQDCQVCGRRFDPLGFQVVVPELGRGFDRVECAQSARSLASPGSRIAAAPLGAVVRPVGLTAAAAPLPIFRPLSAQAATAGLLAAGTVAAAFLWLRVLGTDTVGYPFNREAAPRAVAGQTVEAHVRPSSAPPSASVDRTASPSPDSVPRVVVVRPSAGGGTIAAPARSESPARPSRQPAGGGGGEQGNGKGEGKGFGEKDAGKGKGHVKHGDTQGSHSSGHGQSNAGGGKSQAPSQAGSSGGAPGKSEGHTGQGHGKKH
jgi:hypothetical protein